MVLMGQAALDAVGRVPIILEAVLVALTDLLLMLCGLTGRLRRRGWEWCSAIVALIRTLSIFAAFLVTLRDLAWRLETALRRLLLHPAALVLALVLSLAGKSGKVEPVPPAFSGSPVCSQICCPPEGRLLGAHGRCDEETIRSPAPGRAGSLKKGTSGTGVVD